MEEKEKAAYKKGVLFGLFMGFIISCQILLAGACFYFAYLSALDLIK